MNRLFLLMLLTIGQNYVVTGNNGVGSARQTPLPSCSDPSTQKLLFNESTNSFICLPEPVVSLRLLADVSSSDAVNWTTVPGLTIPVSTGTSVTLVCQVSYSADAKTTALHLTLNGPAASIINYTVAVGTGSDSTNSAVQTTYQTVSNPLNSGGSLRLPASINGSIVFANSGTISVQFRSEIAGSVVTLKRGGWCIILTI